MPSSFHQIVDTIAANANVLFDFDAEPWQLADFEWAPPRRRRNVSNSMLADGGYEASSVLEDRELTITLQSTIRATAQQQAASLNTLARLVSRPAIIKHQPAGVAKPVFFVTRPAEVSVVERLVDELPDRDVVLTIPAEPCAYGLLESGSAAVVNNATASGALAFEFPTILGDAKAPLRLSWTQVSTDPNDAASPATAFLAARGARFGDPADLRPTVHEITNFPSADTGWTVDTVSASTWYNGSARRFVHSGATSTQFVYNRSIALPAGEYRVLARGTIDAGVTVTVGSLAHTVSVQYNSPTWHDLGVLRLPEGAPRIDPARGLIAQYPADLLVRITATGSLTAILDAFVYVPVNLDDSLDSVLAIGSGDLANLSTDMFVLDGENDVAYRARRTTSGSPTPPYRNPKTISASNMLSVLPGVPNVLTFMPQIFSRRNTSKSDEIGLTTTVSWSYFPRYLYLRGDAS